MGVGVCVSVFLCLRELGERWVSALLKVEKMFAQYCQICIAALLLADFQQIH